MRLPSAIAFERRPHARPARETDSGGEYSHTTRWAEPVADLRGLQAGEPRRPSADWGGSASNHGYSLSRGDGEPTPARILDNRDGGAGHRGEGLPHESTHS